MPEQVDEQWRWKMPPADGATTGVLLSDRIRFYAENYKMIDPFDPEALGPASYHLHLSNDYYYENNKRKKPKDGLIKIRKNGLIYVRLEEKLTLPYYMVAQHDLKVRQVYRGFLAGRSLFVDPGYKGHINYPIYNFTDEDKDLEVGAEISAISFIKTTPLGLEEFWKLEGSEICDRKTLEAARIKGLKGFECITFEDLGDRKVPEYWRPGEKHRSSVEQMGKGVDSFKKKLNTFQIVSFLSALAVVIGVIGVFHQAYFFSYNTLEKVREKVEVLSLKTETLEVELKGLKNVKDLKRAIEFSGRLDVEQGSKITNEAHTSLEAVQEPVQSSAARGLEKTEAKSARPVNDTGTEKKTE